MIKLLFVCLGNICRSPTGEGVMQKLVKDRGLSNQVFCDSAGTIAYHAGEGADNRMQKHANARGYSLNSISRKFRFPDDYEEFDYILAMDNQNFNDLMRLDKDGIYRHKLYKMTDYCQALNAMEVPDPYYGGPQGFETVIDIIEDACDNLLNQIIENNG